MSMWACETTFLGLCRRICLRWRLRGLQRRVLNKQLESTVAVDLSLNRAHQWCGPIVGKVRREVESGTEESAAPGDLSMGQGERFWPVAVSSGGWGPVGARGGQPPAPGALGAALGRGGGAG